MKFFGMDHNEVDHDSIEFVYVIFEPKTPESTERYMGSFSWGAKGMGFGVIDVLRGNDDVVYLDTEHMSKSFVKQMLNYWVDNAVTDNTNNI